MRCTYLLRSLSDYSKPYVVRTDDLERRLAEHNAGRSAHTAAHAPWNVTVPVFLDSDAKAEAFERHLKGGSGHAVAKRHFR